MSFKEDLTKEIEEILDTAWDVRDGTVIPSSDSITLKDGAVKIEATFLYADLAGSSMLAKHCPWQTTAKIIRAYLKCCIRIIRAYGGEIRSFDGDRVMGIFIGDLPNTYATKCAREIDWMVESVLNPRAKDKYESISKNNIKITHCVGVDTGIVTAVRAGIRNSNDLIWIGRAPSFAAKLSDIREYPYCVFISEACYKKLSSSAKKDGETEIWEKRDVTFAGEKESVYRTSKMLVP